MTMTNRTNAKRTPVKSNKAKRTNAKRTKAKRTNANRTKAKRTNANLVGGFIRAGTHVANAVKALLV